MDKLILGNHEFNSRLLIGTGKYGSNEVLSKVIQASGSQIITMALRRVDLDNEDENILTHIPKDMAILPNTSGATNHQEAIRIARIARKMGCGKFIKIEVISDTKYLLPDNEETIKATEILAKEGFIVLPYMTPDLYAGKRLIEAGAAAVLVNTAIASSKDPIKMAKAFKLAVEGGREAYLAKAGRVSKYANASSPLTGFLSEVGV